MYVEVSPRRSGKTTRLVDSLIEYIDITENSVYLVTLSPTFNSYILRDLIPPEYHEYIDKLPRNIDKVRKYEMIYVDEVDLCEGLDYFPKHGYYCGTPSSGKLHKLAKANAGYEKYPTRVHIDDIAKAKQFMSNKSFRQEFLADFM